MIMTDEICRKDAAGKFVREHFVRSAESSLLICKCPNLPHCTVPASLTGGGGEISECGVLKFRLKASPSEMHSEVQCGSGLITDLSQQCEQASGG